jgi:hypothetical protein
VVFNRSAYLVTWLTFEFTSGTWKTLQQITFLTSVLLSIVSFSFTIAPGLSDGLTHLVHCVCVCGRLPSEMERITVSVAVRVL